MEEIKGWCLVLSFFAFILWTFKFNFDWMDKEHEKFMLRQRESAEIQP